MQKFKSQDSLACVPLNLHPSSETAISRHNRGYDDAFLSSLNSIMSQGGPQENATADITPGVGFPVRKSGSLS